MQQYKIADENDESTKRIRAWAPAARILVPVECRPMSMAEADACCGQGGNQIVCGNCPLLIEARAH